MAAALSATEIPRYCEIISNVFAVPAQEVVHAVNRRDSNVESVHPRLLGEPASSDEFFGEHIRVIGDVQNGDPFQRRQPQRSGFRVAFRRLVQDELRDIDVESLSTSHRSGAPTDRWGLAGAGATPSDSRIPGRRDPARSPPGSRAQDMACHPQSESAGPWGLAPRMRFAEGKRALPSPMLCLDYAPSLDDRTASWRTTTPPGRWRHVRADAIMGTLKGFALPFGPPPATPAFPLRGLRDLHLPHHTRSLRSRPRARPRQTLPRSAGRERGAAAA